MTSRFREPFAILRVADVGRSLRFYRDLLGFGATYAFPSHDDPQFVSLALGEGKLALGASQEPVDTSSTSVWLYADDVDAATEDLREAGVPIVSEPADQPWGERVASVSDPDGYVVHLGAATG